MSNLKKYPLCKSDTCPHCGIVYLKSKKTRQYKTRDHILPKSWGGGNTLHGGVRNIRYCCVECNSNRAYTFHCVAALACVLDVAKQTNHKPMQLVKRWGMLKIPIEV